MAVRAQTHWVTQVLHLLPSPLIHTLDAWAERDARQRAARRQAAMEARALEQQRRQGQPRR